MRKELLLGCGAKRVKDHRLPTWRELELGSVNANARVGLDFEHLVTLDINLAHNPDIIFDLSKLGTIRQLNSWEDHVTPTPLRWWLPCAYCGDGSRESNDEYDEIHAYEVLEHIGQQGDYHTFFMQFVELHRVLKPNGLLYATCPSWHSPWAWGDPSHTRVLTAGTLAFLSQKEYAAQVGITPMSDFRHVYTADFEPVFVDESGDSLLFILRAIK